MGAGTSRTALRAVAAYGGTECWRAARTVTATVDCGGLLVRWKRGAARYRDIDVLCCVSEPYVRMAPMDDSGTVAVLTGGAVRLERPDGTTLVDRPRARDHFPYGRRLLSWDNADFAYFIGYALWNYLTFPALLLRDDIDWRVIGEHALEARFPPHLPTHAKVQQFHFDPATDLLREYDYVAEVFGGWAKAAHLVTAHGSNPTGLVYPSSRRVRPRRPPNGPGALAGPDMMWADIRDYRVR
jgi:hypothetical protein